jgi:glycosyltransferase involved in cell wall biosynthesis
MTAERECVVNGPSPRVVCFATQGTGHGDERRILDLLGGVGATALPFERRRKARSAWRVLRGLLSDRPDLVVIEGTGIAGGLAVMLARLAARVPYVVSSGDAVGPYVGLRSRCLAPAAAAYERLLCRLSAGFIGWSPYLVGRALTLGAPRAMTAAGWSAPARPEERRARREELGIAADAIVFGLVGSLEWNPRHGYCYGLELVRAVLDAERSEVCALIVGDGSGLEKLREVAGAELGRRVLLPGRVPHDQVAGYLAALDAASLPQSVDAVGSFRYTTKISEYLGAGLPVVTGQIPLAYDLDGGWVWRLAGEAPWDPRYVAELAELMRTVTAGELEERRRAVPTALPEFDRARQRRAVGEFVIDVARRSSGRD